MTHLNLPSNWVTGDTVSLTQKENISNKTVYDISEKIQLVGEILEMKQVLDIKQSLENHEAEDILTEVCGIETKEPASAEGDIIPGDISLNKDKSIDSPSKLTGSKSSSLVVSCCRPPTSTTSARRLLQRALGTEYSVPAASMEEERRLKEALQKKEERRRRRKLEVEERG